MLEDDFQVKLNIKNDSAGKIDLPKNSINLVVVEVVLGYVKNGKKTFWEIYRVLKKGGGFYSITTPTFLSVSERNKILSFFPWHPKNFRLIIINWVFRKLPFWVGCINTSATNWYSGSKIIKIADDIGLRKIICRWQLLDYFQEKKTFKIFLN